MPGVTVTVLQHDITKLATDALIVGFYRDIRPLRGLAGELDWLLCGALSRLILAEKPAGTLGDVALLTSRGKIPAPKIFMIGLGSKDEMNTAVLAGAAERAVSGMVNAGIRKGAVEFFAPAAMSSEDSIPAFLDGLSKGAGREHVDLTVLVSDDLVLDTMQKLAVQKLK